MAVKHLLFLIILFFSKFLMAQLPEGFVIIDEHIPDIKVELRYAESNNFVGKPVDGYESGKCIMSIQAAKALKNVQEELYNYNLCLKIYDAYRPQRAVNHFVRWAKQVNDTLNKQTFYPDIDKRNLFKAGYIASKSRHSSGSTVDLTIIAGETGEELDMGSPWDFFGERSWLDYKELTDKQKANRQLLQSIMLKHGFRNYPKEWWHFTLKGEPYRNQYFDFVLK